MLTEVDRGKFWCRVPSKVDTEKIGDVNRYLDRLNRETVGYVNTFSRRYFTVFQNEPEKDLALVTEARLGVKLVKGGFKKARVKKTPEDMYAKYPHAIRGTLTHDDNAGKNKVKIKCVECGDESRWVYTSDLFQTKMCDKCKKGTHEKQTPSARPTVTETPGPSI